jgi:hypothetical protein
MTDKVEKACQGQTLQLIFEEYFMAISTEWSTHSGLKSYDIDQNTELGF